LIILWLAAPAIGHPLKAASVSDVHDTAQIKGMPEMLWESHLFTVDCGGET